MCLDLAPLGECAWGRCVNGECVCDPGVIQSVELLFHPVPGNATVICDNYVDGAIGSTAAILILTCFVFFWQLIAIENLNQLRRQGFIIVGYFLLVAALSIRLARPTDPLWGFDEVFTYCIVLHIMVYTLQIVVFLNRYNVYLERTLLMRKNTRRTLRVSYAASNLNVVLVIAGSCLWIAPLYIEDLELSGVLTRSGCGLYTVVTGSLTIGNTYLLTKYIQDIKGVMNRSSDKGAPISDKFEVRLRKQLPRVKWVRFVNVTGSFAFCLLLFLATIFEGFLKYFVYILYTILVPYQCGNFCILRAFSKRYRGMCALASTSVSGLFGSTRKVTAVGVDNVVTQGPPTETQLETQHTSASGMTEPRQPSI